VQLDGLGVVPGLECFIRVGEFWELMLAHGVLLSILIADAAMLRPLISIRKRGTR
jgi:hypothetical protein